MAKYALKDKRNGKWWTFGNLTDGDRGPKVGIRLTPELREMIASKKDGDWLNFLGFADDGNRGTASAPQGSQAAVLDDEIPF